MEKTNTKALFIFRRDLRLEDNLGLLKALEESQEVIPLFIFDDRQIDTTKNDFFSAPAFYFMINSLMELDSDLRNRGSQLYVTHGQPEAVVEHLIEHDDIDSVYVNKDYTPFSRKRDGDINDVCEKHQITLERCDDIALSPIETIRTGEDNVYTVYTPFMKKAIQNEVAEPRKNNFHNFFSGTLNTDTVTLTEYQPPANSHYILQGGREEGLGILNNNQYLHQYKDRRNVPADTTGTSKLSAHHKFGTISIRESFHSAKAHSGIGSHFISELYWRDFYLYISYHFPIVFKKSFLPWAKHIEWINDQDQFTAWCEGRTGVPMVDAGMRELNTTGWMHNRSRMIVASYLTKNLLINWQWGEKYFAQKLIDYDPSQNNGGWQWSASTGADPRPLRIFNPYTQAVNYDGDAVYIKRWIPELQDVDSDTLTDGKTQDFSKLGHNYPPPLVDQKMSYHRTMETYKKAKDTYRQEKMTGNS
jgi:deoxyribodipyrimidine photo-lyase